MTHRLDMVIVKERMRWEHGREGVRTRGTRWERKGDKEITETHKGRERLKHRGLDRLAH